MADPILPTACDFHAMCRDLLHAENLRHGADGFTSSPKEGMLRIFFRPKNPMASAGFDTIQINQPTGCNNFSSLLLDVYLQLNMFRASSRPSSGAQQLQ
jgi:hypothetical protein